MYCNYIIHGKHNNFFHQIPINSPTSPQFTPTHDIDYHFLHVPWYETAWVHCPVEPLAHTP